MPDPAAIGARLRRNAAWIVPATLACILVAGFVVEQLPGLTGDTIALVHGAHTIAHCVSHGIFSHCDSQGSWSADGISTGVYHGVIEGDVAPYPMFQYVPAVLFTQLGFGDLAVYKALCLISLVACSVVVALAAWVSSKTGYRWAPALAVLVVTTSPLMLYAGSTFGESLAAMLVVLLCTAALRRWPPVVLGVCALAACLTKETIFPIIALIAAAGLVASPVARRPLRRAHWYGLFCGVAVGIVVSAAFNWFRYGQLTNFTYSHSYEQVPGIGRRLGLSVALWIAPNGGVAIFWTLSALAVVGIIVATGCRRGLRPGCRGWH